MDRLTFDELEHKKKHLADRRDFFQMRSLIRLIQLLVMEAREMANDYHSEMSIHKNSTVCGSYYSFKKHGFNSETDSVRSSDLPFLVFQNMLFILSDRLLKLERISFDEYLRHKKLIDKALFRLFDDKSIDLRDISPENPLYGTISPARISHLKELAEHYTEDELMRIPVNDLLYAGSSSEAVTSE